MAAITPDPSSTNVHEQLRRADERVRLLTAERDALRSELAAKIRELQKRLERTA